LTGEDDTSSRVNNEAILPRCRMTIVWEILRFLGIGLDNPFPTEH